MNRAPGWYRIGCVALVAALVLSAACERRNDSAAGPPQPAPRGAPGPSAAPAPARSAAPSPLRAAASQPERRRAGEMEYLELLTVGAQAEQQLPMIVAIHGLGDRPERFLAFVGSFDVPARIILPRGLTAYGPGYSWFEFGNGKDVALISKGIDHASDKLARALEQIVEDRPTQGKPIVTGFSQGGMLSFAIAVKYPDLIAAAYPMAGVFPEPLWKKAVATGARPPIVALHGEADALVPLAATQRGVDALKKRGWDVELRTYPDIAHTPSVTMGFDLYQLLRKAVREP